MTFPRFHDLVQRISRWNARAERCLDSEATLAELVRLLVWFLARERFVIVLQAQLHREHKRYFSYCVLPASVELGRRITNITRWMPKERQALEKRVRLTGLHKLYLER